MKLDDLLKLIPLNLLAVSSLLISNQPNVLKIQFHSTSRFYDPKIGRFTKADTQTPDLKNPIDLNHYVYVRNTPLKFNDPKGHVPQDPNEPENPSEKDRIDQFIDKAEVIGGDIVDMISDTIKFISESTSLGQLAQVRPIINDPEAPTQKKLKALAGPFLGTISGGFSRGPRPKGVGQIRGGMHIKEVLEPDEYLRWRIRMEAQGHRELRKHLEKLRHPEPYRRPNAEGITFPTGYQRPKIYKGVLTPRTRRSTNSLVKDTREQMNSLVESFRKNPDQAMKVFMRGIPRGSPRKRLIASWLRKNQGVEKDIYKVWGNYGEGRITFLREKTKSGPQVEFVLLDN